MLDLQELIVFLSAAENGNFSETGRSLHLSQPAVSQIIRNLEIHLGTKLFIRKGRTIRLTEAGIALIPMAKELLSCANRLKTDISSLHGEINGEINIACSTCSGRYILLEFIEGFLDLFPMARFNVRTCKRDIAIESLTKGQVDFSLIDGYTEHPDIESIHILRDKISLIVPAKHPWAKFPIISSQSLLGQPLILREEGSEIRDVVIKSLYEHRISVDMLHIVLVIDNSEAILRAVEKGIGITFLPQTAATEAIQSGQVAEVEISGLTLERSLFAVRNKKQPMPRTQIELWNYILNRKMS